MSWVASDYRKEINGLQINKTTIEICLPDLKPYDDKLLKSNIDLD